LPVTLVCALNDTSMRLQLRRHLDTLGDGTRVIFVGDMDTAETYARSLREIESDCGGIGAILDLRGLDGRTDIREPRQTLHLLQAVARTQAAHGRVLLAMSTGPEHSTELDTERELDWCHAQSWMALERSWPRAVPGGQLRVICGDERATQMHTVSI